MDELELFALQESDTVAPADAAASRWRLFTDTVMGGVSSGDVLVDEVAGRRCLHIQGRVRLENNGGFVQIATDLGRDEQRAMVAYDGLALDVYGNDETYNVHLRTEGMRYPWQSYRASYIAGPDWQTVLLPFAEFEPYRVEGELNPAQVRRIGLVAIGRAFDADFCIASVRLYRE